MRNLRRWVCGRPDENREGLRPVIADAVRELLFRMRGGPLRFWRWIKDRRDDQRRDKQFGIVSAGSRELQDSGLYRPEYVRYQPASYRDLREMFDSIPITRKDVFLDFGSGMGRGVCVAATYPFGSVIGIDIAPELCAIARQNIERLRPKLRCSDVEIVNGNALEFEVPAKVSVIYFFNPFRGAILSTVLGNVAESLRGSPRKVRLLFYGTVSTAEFREEAAKHEWLTFEAETRFSTGALALTYTNNRWTATTQ